MAHAVFLNRDVGLFTVQMQTESQIHSVASPFEEKAGFASREL
ncbi:MULTISPECIES: hypothetical protein [unclassified Mesorhizobium]|nr:MULTISPECIES: hypothetical protein [unclassified Mesorhizobium]